MMLPLLIALSAATPAPACVTQAQAIETITELSGEIVGSAHYTGMATTDMLVVQFPETIAMFGFNAAGCYVGQIVIEPARPRAGA